MRHGRKNDTTGYLHCYRVTRGNSEIIRKVYEFEQGHIFVTPVVVAEFYRGARDKQELLKCQKLIAKFRILSLNEDVVKIFTGFFEKFSLIMNRHQKY